MSTVTEFKTAAEQLTAQDRWELYRWLGESQDVRRFRHEELRREIAFGIEQANRSEMTPLDVQAVKDEVRVKANLKKTRCVEPRLHGRSASRALDLRRTS